MKYLIFILSLVFCNKVLSQEYHDIIFLDFEKNNSIVNFLKSENNIWEIGSPHKSIFKSCYSGEKAIMTDTINPYPENNRSSFSITIYKPDYEYNSDLYLEFYHSFDCDTLTDSLYLDFSFDGGKSWFFGTDKLSIFEENFMQRRFQGASYGVLNALPVLSGNSGGWVYEQYFMHWFFPVKKSIKEQYYPDSIICRFNFISDGTQTNKDGWLIDNITIQSWLGSDVDYQEFKEISVYPNPAEKLLNIESSKLIKSIKVYNESGQLRYSFSDINSKSYNLNVQEFSTGTYILRFQNSDGFIASKKFLIK